jgi:hypothetical protein
MLDLTGEPDAHLDQALAFRPQDLTLDLRSRFH